MVSDEDKPVEPTPPKKRKKPTPAWLAWVMAFIGVNPGYKPWEGKPEEDADEKDEGETK